MMTRFLFLFFSCATLLAQRTPFKVNGTVVNNPNLTNTASITWTVVGANISGTAAGSSGGDTIWTNNAGLIELIGSTDVILNPAVVDGASAVAFSLNSSNVLSTSGAKLLTVGSGGTNVAFLQKAAFVPGFDLFLESGGSFFSEFSDSYSQIQPAYLDIFEGPTQGGGDSKEIIIDATTPEITAYYTNVLILDIAPAASDGTTPYTLDTSLAHTTGNLAEFKNNGTERFVVDAKGTGTFGYFASDYYARATIDTSTLSLFKVNANTSSILLVTFPGGTTDGSIQGTVGGGLKYFLQPNVTDASDAIAYKFDTVNVLTNSALIFAAANSGTNLAWITGNGEVHAKDFVMEASSLRTADTSGHSATIQAHDDDDNVRRTFVTLQNGNTPSLTIAPPSGGSVTLQGILKAADGTSGITTNIVAGLVTFTIKNGIIVGVSL